MKTPHQRHTLTLDPTGLALLRPRLPFGTDTDPHLARSRLALSVCVCVCVCVCVLRLWRYVKVSDTDSDQSVCGPDRVQTFRWWCCVSFIHSLSLCRVLPQCSITKPGKTKTRLSITRSDSVEGLPTVFLFVLSFQRNSIFRKC